jgi:multicomponent Na+:H+ antiporter subunit G
MVAELLLLLGCIFVFSSSLGVVRMPDLFCRLQVASKATTLGAFFCLLAAAVEFGTMATWGKALVGILFYFMTAPLVSHVIARAAHQKRIATWDKSETDELAEAEIEPQA